MGGDIPNWLDPSPWIGRVTSATERDVAAALAAAMPGEAELATLLAPAAQSRLEDMARKAQAVTRRHFGRTIKLYAPLYLSSYCSGGCAYCGFAADRKQPRHRLEDAEIVAEVRALGALGIEEVLLLTGERTPHADFEYLRDAVALASEHIHRVTVEAFPMTVDEYRMLAEAGCTGVTVYQETYDPVLYDELHRWGAKKDYADRLDTPGRALAGGIRSVGLGALLGLGEPVREMLSLYRHARQLLKRYWRGGVSLSFPRIRPQAGGYQAAHPVDEKTLAQYILAMRICLPDVPLVLSTREGPVFRDGMAGLGVSKMSVASRTTVGGYSDDVDHPEGQFEVFDGRDVETFVAALKDKGLEPVFKDWERVYGGVAAVS